MSTAVTAAGRRRRPARVLAVVSALVVLGALSASTVAGAAQTTRRASAEVREQLERARAAMAWPHSGTVTIVTFTEQGPLVAQLAVTVEEGDAMMRRVIVEPGDADVRAPALQGDEKRRLPTSPLGFDVDAILEGWSVAIGDPVVLDTGPATPVHLVRRAGSAVQETLFVDETTGVLVRRETRSPDGEVLRVAAYTRLDVAPAGDGRDVGAAAADHRGVPAPTDTTAHLEAARAAGYHVPSSLPWGFSLVAVEPDIEGAVARYSDGLSVVSIHQQHGDLDASTLDGAVVRHVAGRDVWTWPGVEPVRYVWSGDEITWVAVSDAPAEVIDGALGSLPGELVGHDASHRLRRGLDRVWRFVTAPLR